jgi:hypothetical protein
MPVNYLRADDFESFMKERRKALLKLIASSTGHSNSDIIDSSAEGEEGCTGSCALSSHHGINVAADAGMQEHLRNGSWLVSLRHG